MSLLDISKGLKIKNVVFLNLFLSKKNSKLEDVNSLKKQIPGVGILKKIHKLNSFDSLILSRRAKKPQN